MGWRPMSSSTRDQIQNEIRSLPKDAQYNAPAAVLDKVGRNIYQIPSHPLGIIRSKIFGHFRQHYGETFEFVEGLSPIVSVSQNFDVLNFEANHPGRSPIDTYYFNSQQLLRTHTSAHQVDLLRSGKEAFLCVGDVYRRDTVDATHYPVFHQMEGVRVFPGGNDLDSERDLKQCLEMLVDDIFGKVEKRWIDAYFPFTHPSWELEIFYQNEWLEVLGCGVVHPAIMEAGGVSIEKGNSAWAFGLGLERLAMVLFGIPDIRLFWTEDERFTSQFKEDTITTFKPFSKHPACYKDIAFFLEDEHSFAENDFHELVRTIGGDLVESVTLVDNFVHPTTQKKSLCYRINYRSMSRNLTNEEIDRLQQAVRAALPTALPHVTLR